jgi:hypothetical protein
LADHAWDRIKPRAGTEGAWGQCFGLHLRRAASSHHDANLASSDQSAFSQEHGGDRSDSSRRIFMTRPVRADMLGENRDRDKPMIKKVHKADLRLGMFIHDLNCGWMDHSFLRNSFMLRKESDLQKLLESRITDV